MTLGRFLRLSWLGRQRLVAYARILAFASLVSLYPIFLAAMGPDGSDFLAFWSAGKLTLAGHAAQAYDPALLANVQAEVGRSDVFAFVNPPPLLLALWPLGWLSYPAGWVAWTAATYALWLAATRRLYPALSWPIAAFPAALVAAWHAQTGFLTSALQGAAAGWLRERPWRAGLCIAGLIVKPHLALLFPVALVAGRHWRAFGGAVLGLVLLGLVSWAAFGTATMLAYPRSWQVSALLMETGGREFYLRQVTPYALIRLLAGGAAATAMQALMTVWMALLVWRAWARQGDLSGKLALLFAATPLATPYLFAYDLPFVAIPLCWLIERRGTDAQGWWRPALLALYLAPLVVRATALPLGIDLMPLVPLAMVALIWRELAADSGGNAPPEGDVHPV